MVNVRTNSGRTPRFSRAVASVLTVIMLIAIVFAPALTARAEGTGKSAVLNASIDGVDILIKAILDEEQEALALLGQLGADGQTALDAGLYLTSESVILESISVLGQAYGVDLTNFAENLAASVFAPDSGSSFALDADTYALLQGNLEAALPEELNQMDLDALTEQLEAVTVPMQALVEALEVPVNNMMQTLTENAEVNMKPTTLSLPVGDVQVSQVNLVFGTETLSAALSQFLLEIQNDETAKSALAEALNALKETGALDESMPDQTGEEAAEALWEQLPQLAEELAANMAELGMSLSVRAAMDKETEEVVSVGLGLTAEDETMTMDFRFANGAFGVEMYIPGEGTSAAWFVLGDSMVSVYIQEEGETLARLTFRTEGDTYTLTIGDDVDDVVVVGRILEDETSTVITLDTIDGESVGDISLTLRSDDSLTVPGFTEILTLGEEELSQLVATIDAVAEGF